MSHTVERMPSSFRDIIDLWPTRSDLAREIGEQYGTVHQWHLNDSIPGRAFAAIVRAASAHNHPVTHEMLCGFAEAKHRERSGAA